VARRVITRADVEAARASGSLAVGPRDLVTAAAREAAARAGVALRTEDGAPDPSTPTLPPTASLARAAATPERALVTAVGRNRPRVLAEITARVADVGGDVQDISQRIVDGYFSTVLLVELNRVEQFGAFKAEMEALSREGDYKVVVQHERIFQAMHRI